MATLPPEAQLLRGNFRTTSLFLMAPPGAKGRRRASGLFPGALAGHERGIGIEKDGRQWRTKRGVVEANEG